MYGTQLFHEDPTYTEVNNLIPHDRAGLLCTATLGSITTNSSQFYITIGPCPWQDDRDLVFGEVCGGFNLLAKLSAFGSFPLGVPLAEIVISHAGILASLLIELDPLVASTTPSLDENNDGPITIGSTQNAPHLAHEQIEV